MLDRLLKLPVVCEVTGKSKSAIYDDIKKGNFPNSIPIGSRARAWKESDIQAWIEQQSSLEVA